MHLLNWPWGVPLQNQLMSYYTSKLDRRLAQARPTLSQAECISGRHRSIRMISLPARMSMVPSYTAVPVQHKLGSQYPTLPPSIIAPQGGHLLQQLPEKGSFGCWQAWREVLNYGLAVSLAPSRVQKCNNALTQLVRLLNLQHNSHGVITACNNSAIFIVFGSQKRRNAMRRQPNLGVIPCCRGCSRTHSCLPLVQARQKC